MFEFLQNNIFYTPEKIKEINEAQRQSAAANPAAQPPAPRQPISTDRSRYSQGGPRPERVVTPPKEQTGRDARRGSGVSGRTPEIPTINTPQIRGRTGAARGVEPQKPAATAQPPRSMGNLPADYKETEQQAGATAEAFRPGAGFTGTGRGETRVNPNGVEQSGTAMGGRVMTMDEAQTMLGADVQIKNPFLSNALPGTNDDGFAGGDSPVIESIDGKPVEGGAISINEYNTRFPNDNKPVEVKSTEGSANLVQSGGAKVNDINDPSTWDEKYARRRAFLDADDSMSGLKAVQAQKGIVYAGGQHNLVNPNAGQEGENDFVKIDRSDARAYMRGAQGAEDLKAKYINEISTAQSQGFADVGETPMVAQQVESGEYFTTPPKESPEGLTDMPQFSDKDRSGRYNIYR